MPGLKKCCEQASSCPSEKSPKYSTCAFSRSPTGILSTVDGAHVVKLSSSTLPVAKRVAVAHSQLLDSRHPNGCATIRRVAVSGPLVGVSPVASRLVCGTQPACSVNSALHPYRTLDSSSNAPASPGCSGKEPPPPAVAWGSPPIS